MLAYRATLEGNGYDCRSCVLSVMEKLQVCMEGTEKTCSEWEAFRIWDSLFYPRVSWHVYKGHKAPGEVALLGCVRLVGIINWHKYQQQGTVCACVWGCAAHKEDIIQGDVEKIQLRYLSPCVCFRHHVFPPAGLREHKQKHVFDETPAVESSGLSMRGCGRWLGAQWTAKNIV